MAHFVTGTWADLAGQVGNTIAKEKTAANNTATVTIPLVIPSNASAMKGSYLESIDLYWEVTVGALDALTAAIYKVTLPANGAAIGAPDSVTFDYDASHDAANERLTLDQHKMTLTLDTPAWIDNDEVYQVVLTVDAALNSVFEYLGARVNYTFRI
jgi:hypothetical protein